MRILNLSIIIIFLSLSILKCASGVCLPFYDSFENGLIDSHNWINYGWTPDNKEFYAGNHSISSSIIGGGFANISLMVDGPCNVSFKWKIFPGFNKLIFFDNNVDICHIPYRSTTMDWTGIDNYSITDNQSHILKWSQKNENGVGIAWIDDVHIYPIIVKFVGIKIQPESGSSINLFDYDAEAGKSETPFDVELFVTPPNCNNTKEVSLGIKKFQVNASYVWRNVSLDCSDCGEGKYRLVFRDARNRQIDDQVEGWGPHIKAVTYANSCELLKNGTYRYERDMKFCSNALVYFYGSYDGKNLIQIGSKNVTAKDMIQPLYWYTDKKLTAERIVLKWL